MSHETTRSVRRSLAWPFWNRREGRLRAGWRALVPVVALLVVGVLNQQAAASAVDFPLQVLAQQLPVAVVALALLAGWARFVDRRALCDYGFHVDGGWWLDLAAGIAVALVAVGGAFATKLAFGWLTITDWMHAPNAGFGLSLLVFCGAFACVAIWEEIAFRGLLLRNAAEGLWFGPLSRRVAVVLAWVLVSLVFGLLHLNQAPTPLRIVMWILVGSLPGLAYVLTGELALALGFHFAFDLAASSLFNVAAVDAYASLVLVEYAGPDWLVGMAGAVDVAWGLFGMALALA